MGEKKNSLDFGKMENTVIFASSTSLLCGSKRLAIHKASLFCIPAKGVFLPISGGLPLPNAKKRTARAIGLVDGGIRQAAFLSAYVNKSNNAPSRNSHTGRSATQSSRNAPRRGHYSHTAKTDEKVRERLEKTGVPVARNRDYPIILEALTHFILRH